jgi:hypothetical protein
MLLRLNLYQVYPSLDEVLQIEIQYNRIRHQYTYALVVIDASFDVLLLLFIFKKISRNIVNHVSNRSLRKTNPKYLNNIFL